jgi:L,D-peptidoglycan transpeptidase YkuD (ErfK/YbiS/YcfS/YnhG family)
MELIACVTADGTAFLSWPGRRVRCAIGRSGIRADKREGDGATPAGRFALRGAMYRPDRLSPPPTQLALRPLAETDGWCDDPADAAYNRLVRLPHPARREAQPVRCETLWRVDALYDLLIVVGYNDAPVEPGRGSAIFIHVAKPGYAPTEGCVALALPDLLDLAAVAAPGDVLVTGS